MEIINGSARFTAIHDGGSGIVILAFYEKPEDVGKTENSVGMIEFRSWSDYRKFIILQTSLANTLEKQFQRHKNAVNN